MNLILYLSEAVIPILVLLIVGNGLMHRQHVYEDFLEVPNTSGPKRRMPKLGLYE